jgi:hypothetical protein
MIATESRLKLKEKEKKYMINPEALKLYGENDGFFRMVQTTCDFIKKVQPEIYETEEELFLIALERTYRDYLEAREEERRHFKRYKVSLEVQLDRGIDPEKALKNFFVDPILGYNVALHEINNIEEIPI